MITFKNICFLCGIYDFQFDECPIIKSIYNNINLNIYITNIIIKYLQCNNCYTFIHYKKCKCILSISEYFILPALYNF